MKRRLYRIDAYGTRRPASLWERLLHRLGLLGAAR